MNTIPSPTNRAEALQMWRAGLGYLAALDPMQLPASAQAELLQVLEQAHALETAARAQVLRAFTNGQGHHEDGCYGPKSWLINHLGITKGAAAAYLAWARRAGGSPARSPRRAGRRGHLGVRRRHRVRLDRPAPAGLPGRGRRDPGRGRPVRGQPGGPGPAGRRDLRPVPAPGPRRPGRRVRGPVGPAGDHLRRRRGPRRRFDAGMRRGGRGGPGRAVRSGQGRTY